MAACISSMKALETDEDFLFRRAGSPAADKLRKQAKKLVRERDRKAFWDGRKAARKEDGDGQQE